MLHWLLHAHETVGPSESEFSFHLLPATEEVTGRLERLFRTARTLNETDPDVQSLGISVGGAVRYSGPVWEEAAQELDPRLVWIDESYKRSVTERHSTIECVCRTHRGAWYLEFALGRGRVGDLYADGLQPLGLLERRLWDLEGRELEAAFTEIAGQRAFDAARILHDGLRAPILSEDIDEFEPDARVRPIADQIRRDAAAPLLESPNLQVRELAVSALGAMRQSGRSR